jgi:hypothetical protein
MAYRVFISHSSKDEWVALQLESCASASGAETFLDVSDIDHGDDFEERLLVAAEEADELLVLLTPWARTSRYLWMEVGAFWFQRKRIIIVLYGLNSDEVIGDSEIPVRLKRTNFVTLNGIDNYFDQLRRRVNGQT